MKAIEKEYLLSTYYVPSIVLSTWSYSSEPNENHILRVGGKQASKMYAISIGTCAEGQGCCVGAVKIAPALQHCRDPAEKGVIQGRGYCCYFFFNLFICFWLCWVFVAQRELSLVVVSGGYSSLWCTCFSLW